MTLHTPDTPHEFNKDGSRTNLNAAAIETFDVTPEGLKTEAGRARVAQASERLHDAVVVVAQQADALFPDLDEWVATLRLNLNERVAYDELTDELHDALAAWKNASGDFARAVAGR